ncbi:TonB-dependent receptor [Acetobacteraceae bacterium KSS8]|uniref:TonB-dependent receptor n=1 Tax=Endosaccharibacter trunci TaxID=2812733 RepID=A0ABT1W7F7_9PROT|nr:TonB-dependent receptor [Acetobacteraceae bacterium KSS8]
MSRHRPTDPRWARIALPALLASVAPVARVHAADPVAVSGSTDATEQYIVTGTRDVRKTARDSSSPIDIITGAELRRTGAQNVTDALSRLDPSINSSITGGSGFVSGIRMRGLTPNQVLVLVDGKRRNATGVIATYAGPEHGATPVDLDLIPIGAIDHVEVLRDGAAAMYGSDAIAGVINVILKKKPSGLTLSAQTGASPLDDQYHSPGWNTQIAADGGWSLGDDGYLHLSGQFFHTDHYDSGGVDYRSGLKDDQNFSLPEQTRESLAITAGKPITDVIEAYGNITYAHRHIQSYLTNRLPNILPEIYPYGFNPSTVNEENEYAATLGLKGTLPLGFHWDLSTTYGADESRLSTINSANLGYYAIYGTTPTKGFTEAYRNAQWANNLDVTRDLRVLGRDLRVSFGGEHRLETYDITSGNPETYELGGLQGAPGLAPVSAGSWSRDVWAGYVDTDLHPTARWDVDLAGRFEHYTDFGNTETGKISTRYEITPRLAVRATISNGFRAPTLAEENFSSLSVTPTGASGSLAVDSAAAHALGALPLKPERSTSISGGIVAEPLRGWHLTVDAYQINIRDRIVAGGNYVGQTAEDAIALTGIALPPNLALNDISANYFSNGASTRTQGVDIVLNRSVSLGRYGRLDGMGSFDITRTTLHHLASDANGNPLLNAQGVAYLTNAVPRSKFVLDLHWLLRPWDVTLRQTRYGEATALETYQIAAPAALRYSNTQFLEFKNEPRWVTDLEIGYRITKGVRLAVGGQNLFNTLPRELPLIARYIGNSIYDDTVSGIPISGGYYYGRIDFTL